MSDLKVSSLTVPELLTELFTGRVVVPAFQREFVWTIPQVEALAESVLMQRPIGLATLWRVDPVTDVPSRESAEVLGLAPISVDDQGDKPVEFGKTSDAIERYAILDGRQRCTALAMVFGGLRPVDKRRRGAGYFYLDLTADEDAKFVKYLPMKYVEDNEIQSATGALSKGLMPLRGDSDAFPDWNPMRTWTEYIQLLALEKIYSEHERPNPAETERRILRIQQAIEGISSVWLATYSLGSKYDLADICEIFETLNSTGVQVSTTDLIHTFVFKDTAGDNSAEPVRLRNWMDELGKLPGALDWASSDNKPERTAQLATAAYIGLRSRPPARQLQTRQGRPGGEVTSIKAGDLLRTPTEHWKDLIRNQELFAETIGGFQSAVAGRPFPMSFCPYPATACVYVGLAWSRKTESIEEDAVWEMTDLNSVMRAFFWRTALTGRYDQGFLTKVSSDINRLREMLRHRSDAPSSAAWMSQIDGQLIELIGEDVPSDDALRTWCLDERATSGARRLAMRLLTWTGPTQDLATQLSLPPLGSSDVELHHLWPKKWLSNNKTGKLGKLFEKAKAEGMNVVDAPANLVPLLATSNSDWKAKNPGQVLAERDITYAYAKDVFESAFIDEDVFGLLVAGSPDSYGDALGRRASLMAAELRRRTQLAA